MEGGAREKVGGACQVMVRDCAGAGTRTRQQWHNTAPPYICMWHALVGPNTLAESPPRHPPGHGVGDRQTLVATRVRPGVTANNRSVATPWFLASSRLVLSLHKTISCQSLLFTVSASTAVIVRYSGRLLLAPLSLLFTRDHPARYVPVRGLILELAI